MGIRTVGIATAGALAALGSLSYRSAAQSENVAELKVAIHEWTVPTKGALPDDPTVGPDGALWFTEQMTSKLGHLDVKTGKFSEYPLGHKKKASPHGIVADDQGNIWFTASVGGDNGYIGKLVPATGEVIEYKMPIQKANDPHSAVFDVFGILWFTVQSGNIVGKLDTGTGKIILKAVPTEDALPNGIQVNSKNIPVFCEVGSNKIAAIRPENLDITEYTLPETARPRRLAIAADDTVYFTDSKGGNLGMLNMNTGGVTMYPSPGGPESNPDGIAITPDGIVWYSESGVRPNTIVRFDPRTDSFARANIPCGGGGVRNMAAALDSRIYIACSGVDKVGVVEQIH